MNPQPHDGERAPGTAPPATNAIIKEAGGKVLEAFPHLQRPIRKNGQEAWALCPAADEPQGLSFRPGAKDEPSVRVDGIVDKWTTRWIFFRDALRHRRSAP